VDICRRDLGRRLAGILITAWSGRRAESPEAAVLIERDEREGAPVRFAQQLAPAALAGFDGKLVQ